MSNISMLPEYSTVKFTDIWDSAADFLTDYNGIGISTTISSANATTLYYLLYARYGNSPIANRDETQFKYKIFSIIFQYGPTWEKRLSIQQTLRGLTDDQIRLGSKAIYNAALNPSTSPTTASLEELQYINSQNTANYKKGIVEAYSQLWELLKTDVTGDFLNKFKICFKQFVRPENPLLYVTDDDSEE